MIDGTAIDTKLVNCRLPSEILLENRGDAMKVGYA
jgi:hypothetical protein